ncbi:MAG: sortase [Bacilli bacterium]|nr:sortase [Bacilli bacterium]
MCIAAHNYDNDKFFSRINTLSYNDIIYIYNLNGEKQEYNVTKNFETEFNDTSCTSQDTNEKQELTLVTCNNVNNKRIIVKALKKK